MKTIQVFEPALCCRTGVCGVDVDEALVAFTADVEYLKGRGIEIERHNLANDPLAFTADEAVRSFLHAAGSEGLPLVVVAGVTVAAGSYPNRAQLLRFAGSEGTESTHSELSVVAGAETGACGCGPGSCC